MKKMHFLFLVFLHVGCNAVARKNVLEAVFRKIDHVSGDVSVTRGKVCNIKNNTIDLQCTADLTQSAVEVLADSQGFVSTFGESISSPIEDMVSVQFQYGVNSVATNETRKLLLTTSLLSTGTVFSSDSMAIVSTGTAVDGEASIESERNLRYRPGHEGYAFFTALFESNAANSTQWIGLFDDLNGTAIGYNGTTFSILFRRDGDVDTTIPQSSFNRDTLDGTGPSGFNYNSTKLNVFRISYGWLGAAPIKFQIARQDGVWVTFHIIERPNSADAPHFLNPILPIQAEVKNSGNTSDLQLKTASWNAGIVGSPSTAGHRFFSKGVVPTDTIPDTETHMLTIQNKSAFQSKANKIEVRVTSLGGGPLKSGNDAMIIRLRKNATVSGTSFVDFDINASVIEFSESGTYSADTGQEIFLLPSNGGSGTASLFFPQAEFAIFLLPGESITITGISILGAGVSDSVATISWEERF